MLLLDEPLGALDAKLRHSLRAQLTALQREVGITFVFVTHDQEEALEMSDRLAVMSKGRIMQLGTPRDIYQHPQSEFVADFLGRRQPPRRRGDRQRRASGPVKLGEFTLDAQIPEGYAAGPGPSRHPARERAARGGRPHRRQPACPAWSSESSTSAPPRRCSCGCRSGSVVQALVTNAVNEEPWASGDACRVRLPSDSLRVLETVR